MGAPGMWEGGGVSSIMMREYVRLRGSDGLPRYAGTHREHVSGMAGTSGRLAATRFSSRHPVVRVAASSLLQHREYTGVRGAGKGQPERCE